MPSYSYGITYFFIFVPNSMQIIEIVSEAVSDSQLLSSQDTKAS
jgi:hypothetical protein